MESLGRGPAGNRVCAPHGGFCIMQRGELALGAVLLAILLAGIAYENYRGADKTAEIVISHPGVTPFDATAAVPGMPASNLTAPASTLPGTTPDDAVAAALVQFLNQAGLEELVKVPGIGPVLAQRILDRRAALGNFTDVKQIDEISGIGPAKMNDLLRFAESLLKKPAPAIRPAAPAPAVSSPAPFRRATPARPTQQKIPLNQATREDLLKVPGIGEHLAEALLQARTQAKGFKTWQQVDAVSGIGGSRLSRLQEYFTLPQDQ